MPLLRAARVPARSASPWRKLAVADDALTTGALHAIGKIVSGGQCGTDRAALDWAIENKIEHGGWCPTGRLAEDGAIPERYQLTELPGASYRQRTRRNVEDSSATLVLNVGEIDGGTLQTVKFAERAGKPLLVLNLDQASLPASAHRLNEWLAIERPGVLNVAGPRESKRPGIGALTRSLLDSAAALGR